MGTLHTRERLVEAGERLMADHGIDGVSLRQIGAAAGERNTAAVQYHFGGRDELISAIFERRMGQIDAGRAAMLGDLERAGRPIDLRQALEVAIFPLAEHLLESGPAGAAYLLFLAQVHRHAQHRVIDAAWEAGAVGLQRVLGLIEGHLAQLPPDVLAQRMALMTCLVIHALADHAQRVRTAPEPPAAADTARFVSHLVDAAFGLLTAPVSPVMRPDARPDARPGHAAVV